MARIAVLRRKYLRMRSTLNERSRRLWAATEALEIGRGGIVAVRRATGLSYTAVARGISDIRAGNPVDPVRVRRPGGGRKRLATLDGMLAGDLEGLVEPLSRGDPETRLRWTCKSLRHLSKELEGMGHQISHTVVGEMLREIGYSLQANRKNQEGKQHPAPILVVPDEFLLLRVNGDGGLAPPLLLDDRCVDELELRVAVRVLLPLLVLSVGL